MINFLVCDAMSSDKHFMCNADGISMFPLNVKGKLYLLECS